MSKTIQPAPVRRSIDVQAPQAKAFDTFTKRATAWWPKSHHVGKAELAEVVIEPKSGGRWYERDADGDECEWGYVIAWDPPRGLILAWQLDASFAFDPKLVTEVEVKFVPLSATRTRVELEHRHLERYGDKAAEIAGRVGHDNDWTAILKSFGAVVEAG